VPVSAVDCVQPAIQHARQQLFTRFRWGQWSRLALVGILATEMHVGGCSSPNFNFPINQQRRSGQGFLTSASLPHGFPPINPAHLPQYLGQFLGLIVVAIFVAVALLVVFLYINSVFRFILFDSVLRRECSISEGWRKWHRAGGRFFLWQIVFLIATWLFMLVVIGVPLALAFAAGWMTNLREHIGRMILGVVLLVGLFLVFALTAAIVQVLARDFLVPIMAFEDVDFADGWRRLLGMIGREKGRYAGYLLLKLALSIAAGILFSIIAIIPMLFVIVPSVLAVVAGNAAGMGWNVTTISLAIIFGSMLFFLLIYLVALVSVPATVFFPAYAMYFFASRYPNLDALLNPAPAPPAPEAPPLPESPPPLEPPPLPPSPEPIG
jgi:hypothetical protein